MTTNIDVMSMSKRENIDLNSCTLPNHDASTAVKWIVSYELFSSAKPVTAGIIIVGIAIDSAKSKINKFFTVLANNLIRYKLYE